MSNFLVKSLNLGLIDSALNWLIGALTTLLQLIINWTIDLFILIFAEFFYSIGLTLLSFVDFFQAFFNALCGMGTYWDSNGVKYVDQDPILSLVTNQTVLQVFLALTIVAIIMLILTTIIAMVRTEFTTEGAKNSKGTILGSALKSLAMFFIVPAACVLGIVLSNGLLNAVYNATSGGNNVSAGAMVWYASSYNANKVRNDNDFYNEHWGSGIEDKYSKDFKLTGSADTNRETIAMMIDEAFKNRSLVITSDLKNLLGTESYSFTDLMSENTTDTGLTSSVYSYRNVTLTSEYYTIRSMNFLVMFMGGGIAVYIMFIAAFGLIIRLYKVAILFMVSAPITALTPLDGGAAYKNWRKLMIGSVASAFSVVVAFNLIFMLIPLMDNINLFNPTLAVAGVWNRLVNLLFVLTGLYSIKETSKWVSSMLGIEDPLAAGGEIAGKVMGTVGKMGTIAATGGAAIGASLLSTGARLKSANDSRLSEKLMKESKNKNLSSEERQGLKKRANSYKESSKNTSAWADKVSGFGGKMSGIGEGVIGKTVQKNMNRMDDFMGGANIFGGSEDEGVGKFVKKGLTKAYRGGIMTPAAAASFIPGAVSGHNKWMGGDKQKRDKILEDIEKDEDKAKNAKTETTRRKAEARIQTNKEKLKTYGTGVGRLFDGGTSFARGADTTSATWGEIRNQGAGFNAMKQNAQDYGENIEKNVGDAMRAAKMYGGISTDEGKTAATEAAKNLAKALQIPLKEVFDKLANDNDREKMVKDSKKPLSILNNFDIKNNVDLNGFNANSIGGTGSAELSKMMTSQGIDGTSLQEQFKNQIKKIEDEMKKAEAELKKETDKMMQQATLIAKQMKRINPYKGK